MKSIEEQIAAAKRHLLAHRSEECEECREARMTLRRHTPNTDPDCRHFQINADASSWHCAVCDEEFVPSTVVTALSNLLMYVDSLHPDNQIDTQPESQAARELLAKLGVLCWS